MGEKGLLTELLRDIQYGSYTPEEGAAAILMLFSDKTFVAMPRVPTTPMLKAMKDWPYGSGSLSSVEEMYNLAVKSVHG